MSWLSRALRKAERWVKGNRGKLLDLFDGSYPSARTEFLTWALGELSDLPQAASLTPHEMIDRLPDVNRALDVLKGLRAKLK